MGTSSHRKGVRKAGMLPRKKTVVSSGDTNRAARRQQARERGNLAAVFRLARQAHDECARCRFLAYASCECCQHDHPGM